jgi:phosphoadenosine phosphosulfate reductase
LIDRARELYGLPVDIYTPDERLLQGFVREHGVNAFYRSVDLRKACCGVRKTEPLARALSRRAPGSPGCAARNR